MEPLCISIVGVERPQQKNFSLKPPVRDAFNDLCEAFGERKHSVVATAAILMFLEAAPEERQRRIIEVAGASAVETELAKLVAGSLRKGGFKPLNRRGVIGQAKFQSPQQGAVGTGPRAAGKSN